MSIDFEKLMRIKPVASKMLKVKISVLLTSLTLKIQFVNTLLSVIVNPILKLTQYQVLLKEL